MPVTGAAAGAPALAAPPSEVENALAAARARGDWDGYVRVLLGADVFAYVSRQAADWQGPDADYPLYDAPPGAGWGAKCHVVHTRGELLAPRPDMVPLMVALPAESAKSSVGVWVNPGTSSEAYFPGTNDLLRHWKRLAKEVSARPGPGPDDALVTKYTGPLHGPLAHALACGAHLAVHRRVFWNELGDVYDDYPADIAALRDTWGVTDRQSWQAVLARLLDGQGSPPRLEFVLSTRPGAHADQGAWAQAAVTELRSRGGDEAEAAAVHALTGQILGIEARFRADGVLRPDGFVTSAVGYDYGRAVNVARWGLGARYAAPQEAEQAVLRAGELCRERYASWEEFSAGYALGCVLDIGPESAVVPHRILLGDPGSPWRNIPFRSEGAA
jgi:Protein of unknown function (DUF1266)